MRRVNWKWWWLWSLIKIPSLRLSTLSDWKSSSRTSLHNSFGLLLGLYTISNGSWVGFAFTDSHAHWGWALFRACELRGRGGYMWTGWTGRAGHYSFLLLSFYALERVFMAGALLSVCRNEKGHGQPVTTYQGKVFVCNHVRPKSIGSHFDSVTANKRFFVQQNFSLQRFHS